MDNMADLDTDPPEPRPLKVFKVRVADQLSATPGPDIMISGIEGGVGKPLLLLHGFPQSSVAWTQILDILQRSFRLIAMDLRGYGASSQPSIYLDSSRPPTDEERIKEHELYNEWTLAKDCVNLMEQFGYKQFGICGHDRGARVAHSVCTLFPHATIKAMFLDISPALQMYEDTNMRFAQDYFHWFFLTQPYPLPEKCITSQPLEFLKRFMPIYRQLNRETILHYLDQLSNFRAVHSMCEDYRATMAIDIEQAKDDLADNIKVKCPLRILWAKKGILHDPADPEKPLRDWIDVHKHGNVTGAAVNCGHFMLDEKPDEIAQAILAFFSTMPDCNYSVESEEAGDDDNEL